MRRLITSFRYILELSGEEKYSLFGKMTAPYLTLPYTRAFVVDHQWWLGPKWVSGKKNKECNYTQWRLFFLVDIKKVYLADSLHLDSTSLVFTLLQIFMHICETSVLHLSKSLRCYIQSSPFGRFWKILFKECQC